MHYVGSEADTTNNFNGTNPTATLTAPGYVHQIGSWTTFDWQISYEFGKPEEITPEAPKAGYNKEVRGLQEKPLFRQKLKDLLGEFAA